MAYWINIIHLLVVNSVLLLIVDNNNNIIRLVEAIELTNKGNPNSPIVSIQPKATTGTITISTKIPTAATTISSSGSSTTTTSSGSSSLPPGDISSNSYYVPLRYRLHSPQSTMAGIRPPSVLSTTTITGIHKPSSSSLIPSIESYNNNNNHNNNYNNNNHNNYNNKKKNNNNNNYDAHGIYPQFSAHHNPYSYPPNRNPNPIRRNYEYGYSEGYSAVEKSDFYYIFPILLVIGLGSFLIPIISTFFTAMITSNSGLGCCGKRTARLEMPNGELLKPALLDKVIEVLENVEGALSKGHLRYRPYSNNTNNTTY